MSVSWSAWTGTGRSDFRSLRTFPASLGIESAHLPMAVAAEVPNPPFTSSFLLAHRSARTP
jgi:hypothetical protein